MNVFGLLATLIICITVLGVVWLVIKHPISFKIIKTTEAPKIVIPKKMSSETVEKIKQEATESAVVIKESEPKVVSMDAVIQAANKLMGIASLEEDK